MRTRVIVFIVLIVLVGLLSRSQFALQIIPLGVGDALYGTMMYLLVRWVFIDRPAKAILLFAISICFVIELSQLITLDWFESVRSTFLGKLILGNNFKLSDFIYLTVGVIGGYIIDIKFLGPKMTDADQT